MDDLNHDPSTRQIVQSPANVSCEAADARSICQGYDASTRHELPSQVRETKRMTSMFAMPKPRAPRSGKSRR